ncbi:MAG: class I SAM-dependent methyltransferase [Anaerolineales bacterium]|jgi:SAM-dependent methyltransferase
MTDEVNTPSENHARYSIQAEWTAELRTQILSHLQIGNHQKLLEVGSGTGVIAASIANDTGSRVFGADIDARATSFAHRHYPGIHFTIADGHSLPFASNSLEAAFCHFLLLWVDDPPSIIREMQRVVKPGGWLIAFAEPDYGARIDYPRELERIGALQIDALEDAGANTHTGRRLRDLFSTIGLKAVSSGVLGAEWKPQMDERLIRSEWLTLRADLKGLISESELNRLEQADLQAWNDQSRILFVPTFYAYGQVR